MIDCCDLSLIHGGEHRSVRVHVLTLHVQWLPVGNFLGDHYQCKTLVDLIHPLLLLRRVNGDFDIFTTKNSLLSDEAAVHPNVARARREFVTRVCPPFGCDTRLALFLGTRLYLNFVGVLGYFVSGCHGTLLDKKKIESQVVQA